MPNMKTAFKIRNWIFALVFVASFGGATLSVATPQPVYAACNERLLTFPAWYRGLVDGSCMIQNPTAAGGLPKFIAKIALNIIEFMLQLVGYLAVGYIIAGGFKFLTSTGSSDDIAKSRKTILNAVIGLVISIFSIGIVNVVVGIF